MWSCWIHPFTLFCFFVMDIYFETQKCQCHTWLNVTAYYNAPWHYNMLRFILMFHWYICICILNCTVRPRQRRGSNPHFIFRYYGTIKDLTLKRSLCSQNGLLSLVDRFVRLGVFFASYPLLQKDLDASHHCTCTPPPPDSFFLYF